jgi:hypothetical protein
LTHLEKHDFSVHGIVCYRFSGISSGQGFSVLVHYLVVDCTLDDCATDTCGGEELSCSRTCPGGVFGTDAECLAEDEVKTETCPALACGKLKL